MDKRAIAIIIAGFFTVSIAYAIRYGYGMLLPEMLLTLDMTKTQAGSVFAVYFIIYTVLTPIMGALSDFYSYRFILTVFVGILASGALAMAFTASYLQTMLFYAISGFGHAACWAPVVVLAQKWVPDNKRGTALAFVTAGVGSGVFLWGILLPLIVNASGWRTGWLAIGLTGMGIAILNFILVRSPENHKPAKGIDRPDIASFLASYQDIFRQASFWLIGFSYLMVGFNVITLFGFLPVYARESLNFTYTASTIFISIIGFFGIVSQLSISPLSDKIGRIKILKISNSIMGLTTLGVLLSGDSWAVYVVTAIYGLGYGVVWPLYAATAGDLFPGKNTGGVVGSWTLFLGLGSMIAPIISGWIIDHLIDYTWVFLSATIAGLLSAALLFLVPVKRPGAAQGASQT